MRDATHAIGDGGNVLVARRNRETESPGKLKSNPGPSEKYLQNVKKQIVMNYDWRMIHTRYLATVVNNK